MVRYISGDDLVALIKSDKRPRQDYVLIDVRDDDYVGGNIKGALNYPSAEFHNHVDKLVEETRGVPMVVFHCALSQSRGPKAAHTYEAILHNAHPEHETEVLILRGGFSQFQIKHKDDPQLVENYDKSRWEFDY